MSSPGKFQANADPELAVILYNATLEGTIEEVGSVQSTGWYALVDHDSGVFIVEEDPNGFFTILEGPLTAEIAADKWVELRDEITSFVGLFPEEA